MPDRDDAMLAAGLAFTVANGVLPVREADPVAIRPSPAADAAMQAALDAYHAARVEAVVNALPAAALTGAANGATTQDASAESIRAAAAALQSVGAGAAERERRNVESWRRFTDQALGLAFEPRTSPPTQAETDQALLRLTASGGGGPAVRPSSAVRVSTELAAAGPNRNNDSFAAEMLGEWGASPLHAAAVESLGRHRTDRATESQRSRMSERLPTPPAEMLQQQRPPEPALPPVDHADLARVEAVLSAVAEVLRVRAGQRVRVGDWVRVTPAHQTVEKVDCPPQGINRLDAPPGRPARYTCRVTSVEPRAGGLEAVTVDAPGVGMIVRRTPGAGDAPIAFPCVAAGCTAVRFTSNLVCVAHTGDRAPTGDAVRTRLAQAEIRQATLAHLAAREFEFPELQEAVAAELLHVTAEVDRLRRADAARASREASAAEDVRRRREATERAERAELERLMAKYQVQAAPPPVAGGVPAVHERRLEL